MAVRLAAPVQPRDGLLTDVAALREADRAVVEAGLLRDRRVVEVDPVAGAAGLDADDLGRGLVDGDRAGGEQRVAHARGVLGGADDVDPEVGRDEQDRRAAELGAAVGVLGGGQVARTGDVAGVRADDRQQPLLERALVQLGVPADRAAAEMVEERLERRALGEQQELVAGVQDAQVAEHLALVRQQRRVAAGAGGERLDVVGDLAVEHLGGLPAGERELAELGAVEDAGARGERPVGGVADLGRRGHGAMVWAGREPASTSPLEL